LRLLVYTAMSYCCLQQYETISTGAADKKESPKKIAAGPTTIPPHSLMAFGLFLRLPGYAEMLIKQRLHAKFILRLVLGVRDGGEGTPILSSPVASALPTLPFTNLKVLFSIQFLFLNIIFNSFYQIFNISFLFDSLI